MKLRILSTLQLSGMLLLFSQLPLSAGPIIDFESLSDNEAVVAQFTGLTFSNATVLTAGISLNEFEFPPHSGSNVVFDDGGAITIAFGTPVSSFSAYFTYLELLTITGFDNHGESIGSVSSSFARNLALSGDQGSSPNEFLSLTIQGGISQIVIASDLQGTSFTMDDLTYGASTSIPESDSLFLFLIGGAVIAVLRNTFL